MMKIFTSLLKSFSILLLLFATSDVEATPVKKFKFPNAKPIPHHGTTLPPTTATPTTLAPTTLPPTTTNTSNPLQFHGGPILVNPRVYFYYYGDWNNLNPGGIDLINEFTTNLNGTSLWNTLSTLYGIDSTTKQYQYATPYLTFSGYYLDTSYIYSQSLSDLQIQTLITDSFAAGIFPQRTDSIYLVITSPDVTYSGFCVSSCGWHTAASINNQNLVYGIVGSASHCGGCMAQTTTPNNNVNADNTINIVFHELVEATSDPYFNAWYGSNYVEDMDDCAWIFGSTWTTTNGANANVHIGNKDYLVQEIWTNSGSGSCIISVP